MRGIEHAYMLNMQKQMIDKIQDWLGQSYFHCYGPFVRENCNCRIRTENLLCFQTKKALWFEISVILKNDNRLEINIYAHGQLARPEREELLADQMYYDLPGNNMCLGQFVNFYVDDTQAGMFIRSHQIDAFVEKAKMPEAFSQVVGFMSDMTLQHGHKLRKKYDEVVIVLPITQAEFDKFSMQAIFDRSVFEDIRDMKFSKEDLQYA